MKREELLQISKPILFNTDMVRAILDGRKTVTRRRPSKRTEDKWFDYTEWVAAVKTPGSTSLKENEFYEQYPPYLPGDILYVRETWGEGYEEGTYIYKADDKLANLPEFKESSKLIYHPSIHMPKEAARIFLKVTNVRVERLQDMPHDGPLKEGIHYCECPGGFAWKSDTDMYNCYTTPMGCMKALWDSTIKKSDIYQYGWDANPWAWVIEFERVVEE